MKNGNSQQTSMKIPIWIWVSIGGLILFAIVISLFKKSDDDDDSDKVKPPTDMGYTPPITTTPASNKPDIYKWLTSGSRGQEVKLLQQKLKRDIDRLNKKGRKINLVGTIDGVFGEKTKDALWNVKGIIETSLYNYDKTADKKIGDDSFTWWIV